ncbi:hypothetical protein SAMN05192534_10189 [Alteribacillus persepolensis]|uniref:Uncharacterized protein n=1 Tax=Alteribacillus persepolensis TaxID=568899 RepID=A0A1G7YE68_9BACI|nr:hypothetical protein SAMN05192534_10189 [Alteribacillus persepolensis]
MHFKQVYVDAIEEFTKKNLVPGQERGSFSNGTDFLFLQAEVV